MNEQDENTGPAEGAAQESTAPEAQAPVSEESSGEAEQQPEAEAPAAEEDGVDPDAPEEDATAEDPAANEEDRDGGEQLGESDIVVDETQPAPEVHIYVSDAPRPPSAGEVAAAILSPADERRAREAFRAEERRKLGR